MRKKMYCYFLDQQKIKTINEIKRLHQIFGHQIAVKQVKYENAKTQDMRRKINTKCTVRKNCALRSDFIGPWIMNLKGDRKKKKTCSCTRTFPPKKFRYLSL